MAQSQDNLYRYARLNLDLDNSNAIHSLCGLQVIILLIVNGKESLEGSAALFDSALRFAELHGYHRLERRTSYSSLDPIEEEMAVRAW
jgi:hypothetical protein